MSENNRYPDANGDYYRNCPVCEKETKLGSIKDHSIGLLHAGCSECGFCLDCDEGNV